MVDQSSRRQYLKTLGITASIGLAGCSQQLEPDNSNTGDTDTGSSGSDPDSSPVENESSEADEDSQNNDLPRFQESGTFYIELSDGSPGPEGFFDQGEQLEGEPDSYLSIDMTFEELKQRQHFTQIQETAKIDGKVKDNQRQTLAQVPENINNHEWIINKLSEQMGEAWHGGDPENPFNFEEYNTDEGFGTRYRDSNMEQLRTLVSLVTIQNGPSSGNDYIYADLFAATENKIGKETYGFHEKTEDGTHGLTWMIEKPRWEPSNNQEIWIMETDSGEEKELVDLDEEHGYNIKSPAVFTEKENTPESAQRAWKRIGKQGAHNIDYENITVDFHPTQEFEQALEDPEEHPVMTHITSSLFAAYIDENAGFDHEDQPTGEYPELNGAHLDVYSDRVEFQLAE